MASDDRRMMPLYTISVASQLCHLPIYTIRWLENNEIFIPARSTGRQRMFSDADIEFLAEVASLLERKVNLAGIRVILQIKRTHKLRTIAVEIREED